MHLLKILLLILSIILAILIIVYFNNLYIIKESFCYGNVYCNGNKKDSLCINQKCLDCGLEAQCNKNEDCGPNLCINGCCDTM
jgi:hypothetical protein